MVDKAALDRSGAVAMGLSAINQYVGVRDGDNTCEDYVNYVRQDLMGVSREDLVYNIARHVDSTVHLFEKWGLKIWMDENGKYVHEGRWQLMINGESYKIIIAEAAKNAVADAGGEIIERVFICEPLMDGNKCVGAVGFSTREEKFYVFKAKATMAPWAALFTYSVPGQSVKVLAVPGILRLTPVPAHTSPSRPALR